MIKTLTWCVDLLNSVCGCELWVVTRMTIRLAKKCVVILGLPPSPALNVRIDWAMRHLKLSSHKLDNWIVIWTAKRLPPARQMCTNTSCHTHAPYGVHSILQRNLLILGCDSRVNCLCILHRLPSRMVYPQCVCNVRCAWTHRSESVHARFGIENYICRGR